MYDNLGSFLKRKRKKLKISGRKASRFIFPNDKTRRGENWVYYMENRSGDLSLINFLLLARGLNLDPVDLLKEYLDSLGEKMEV